MHINFYSSKFWDHSGAHKNIVTFLVDLYMDKGKSLLFCGNKMGISQVLVLIGLDEIKTSLEHIHLPFDLKQYSCYAV